MFGNEALGDRRRNPGYVTTGTRQARYKAKCDRVGYSEEHERNCRRGGVNRNGGLRRGGDDDVGVKRHKLGDERGDAVGLALDVANIDLKVASHLVSPCTQRIAQRLLSFGNRGTLDERLFDVPAPALQLHGQMRPN